MARINLLPWREERRQELKNQFLVVFGMACAVGFGSVYALNMQVNAQVDHQRVRNDFVRQEMVALDAQIAEIAELKRKREKLLERMTVIQNLQGNRPLIVHVFDELARTVPDGAFYTSVRQAGTAMSASGLAESNTRISNFMRNIDASPHFSKPVLSKVQSKLTSKNNKEWSGFDLTFQIDTTGSSTPQGGG